MDRTKRIVYVASTSPDAERIVAARFGSIVEFKKPAEMMDFAPYVTALITADSVISPPGFFEKATQLEWVHVQTHGYNRLFSKEFAAHPATLTNTAVLADPVAEQVFALLLSMTRRVPELVIAQRAHKWERLVGTGLTDKTMCVIGVGPIGKAVARRARGFAMKVIGVSRNPVSEEFVDEWRPVSKIDDVLPAADVVVIAVPYNEGTANLFDARRLALLKREALIVNIARGGIVDEVALKKMLDGGLIAGAGFDVFEKEPLPEDSPLWDTQNMVVFPHLSGFTSDSRPRLLEFIVGQIDRYLKGEPLENVVKPGLAR